MADNSQNDAEMSNKMEISAPESNLLPMSRMKTLRDVMEKTVDSFTNNLRLIKPLSNVDNSILKHLEKQMISQLRSNIKTELDHMYSEENVEPLLNGLDDMLKSSESAEHKTWRPSGNPRLDMQCQVAKLKLEKLSILQKQLGELEGQNKLLQSKVEKKENQLLRTKDKIVATAEEFEETIDEECKLFLTPKDVKC